MQEGNKTGLQEQQGARDGFESQASSLTSLSMLELNILEADVEKENERGLGKAGIQYPNLTAELHI